MSRVEVKQMTFLAATPEDFARAFRLIHAILFYKLNLAVAKPFDSLSPVSSLSCVRRGLHDMVEFQPMSERRFDRDKDIEAGHRPEIRF